MGVRGARETPIRLIVPVYTRAGARELPQCPLQGAGTASVYTRAGARELPVGEFYDLGGK